MVQQQYDQISSADGKLSLQILTTLPMGAPKGVVQIAHGMTEYKERYLPFLHFLSEQGYAAVIHDHRGHGNSILTTEDYGYFYDSTGQEIVRDLYKVSEYAKAIAPQAPLYLFAHSMGTLVARNYLKEHDGAIEKLVLCGPPCNNSGAGAGLALVHVLQKRRGGRCRVSLVDKLVFGGCNRKFTESKVNNRWLCSVPEEVEAYNNDPKCGFLFTLNGFENLLKLMIGCYSEDGWGMEHPELPVLFLGGADDPIIGGGHRFHQQIEFLRARGYQNVSGKLYSGKRHELLHEDIKEIVYQDVLAFLQRA